MPQEEESVTQDIFVHYLKTSGQCCHASKTPGDLRQLCIAADHRNVM